MRDRRARVQDIAAECRGCHWRANSANTLAIAAQHHDATGHEVQVVQTIVVVYGRQPTPEELGQTTFVDQGAAP